MCNEAHRRATSSSMSIWNALDLTINGQSLPTPSSTLSSGLKRGAEIVMVPIAHSRGTQLYRETYRHAMPVPAQSSRIFIRHSATDGPPAMACLAQL